jgi:hypothetical protein
MIGFGAGESLGISNSLRELAVPKCIALALITQIHLKMNPLSVFEQAHPP